MESHDWLFAYSRCTAALGCLAGGSSWTHLDAIAGLTSSTYSDTSLPLLTGSSIAYSTTGVGHIIPMAPMAAVRSPPPSDRGPLLPANSRQDYGTVVVQQAPPRATRRNSCCNLGCCCGVLVLVLTLLPVLVVLCIWYLLIVFSGCPLSSPLCWPWKSSEPWRPPLDLSNATYHVGFHLTAGYGTAAIRYSNGTSVVVGRVDGDQGYKDFFTEISYEDSRHPSPPYYNYHNASRDSARQWKRHYRKQAGKPASEGAAALTRVLSALIGPVNDTLGEQHALKYATIAVPAVPAIYNEDLVDAAQFLGVSLVLGRAAYSPNEDEHLPLYDINYALVGMDFSDRDWTSYALSVSYTDDLFTMHIAYDGYSGYMWKDPIGVARADLGRRSLDGFPSPDEYWFAVQKAMQDVLSHDDIRYRPLRTVVVHGERAMDATLWALLQRELDQFQQEGDHVSLHSVDPVYAGAVGAAKLGLKCLQGDGYGGCFPDLRPKGRQVT